MAIEVKSPRRVLVDGTDAGDVVSVIANYGTRKKEILDALVAWHKADNDATAAKLGTKENRIAELQAEVAALKTERQALRAMTKEGRREAAAAKLARQREANAKAEADAAKELADIDAE